MSSPFATFRKNQKSWMAALVLVAIFAFVIAPVFDYARNAIGGAGNDAVAVMWNGGQMTVSEVQLKMQKHASLVRFLAETANRVLANGGTPRVPGFQADEQSRQIFDLGIQTQSTPDGILRTRLLADYAKSQGVQFDDAAIDQFIQSFVDDRLSSDEVAQILSDASNNTLTYFEVRELLKEQLSAQVIARAARSGLFADAASFPAKTIVSPGKSFADFCKVTQTAKVEAFPVLVSDYVDQVTGSPTETEVEDIYNRGAMYPPDPRSPNPGFARRYKTNIEYIEANLSTWIEKEKAKLTEEELRKEYDRRVELGQLKVVVQEEPADASATDSPTEVTGEAPDTESGAGEGNASQDNSGTDESGSASGESNAESDSDSTPVPTTDASDDESNGEATELESNSGASDGNGTESGNEGSADGSSETQSEAAESEDQSSAVFPSDSVQFVALIQDETPQTQDPNEERPPSPKPPAPEVQETEETQKEEAPKEEGQKEEGQKEEGQKEEGQKEEGQKEEAPKEEAVEQQAAEESTSAADTQAESGSAEDGIAGADGEMEETTPPQPADEPAVPADEPAVPADEPQAEVAEDAFAQGSSAAASSEGDSEEASAESDGPVMRTLSFEEAKEQIADSLATLPALQALDQALTKVMQDEMETYYSKKRDYESFEEAGLNDEDATPPVRPDLKKIAEGLGLTVQETGLIDGMDLAKAKLGLSEVQDPAFGGRPVSVANLAATPQLELFKPMRSRDDDRLAILEGRTPEPMNYIFWKIEEEQAYAPELEEARAEVVDAWKQERARELAQAAAQDLAKKVTAGEGPWDNALSDAEKSLIVETAPFTWLNPMGGNFISAVDKIDYPGNDFMQAVFSTAEGEVGVAPNSNKSTYYVFRIVELAPDAAELHQKFEDDPLTTQTRGIAESENNQLLRSWEAGLQQQFGVQWQPGIGQF